MTKSHVSNEYKAAVHAMNQTNRTGEHTPAGQITALSPDSACRALLAETEQMDSEHVRLAYDVVASEYAKRFSDELLHKPFDAKMLEWFIERAGSDASILDLGCGPGHVAAYVHAKNARVRGIDLSPEMVLYARRLHPEIPFEQGNMLMLEGIPDASLDGVLAFYSLVHFNASEVDQALHEIRRILRPGGWLLVAVHLGDGTIRVESFLEQGVSLQFTFFDSVHVRRHVESAGFDVTEGIERDPYAEYEYPSRRLYLFARAR